MTEQKKRNTSAVALAARQEVIAQRGDTAETLALCDAIDDLIEKFDEIDGESGLDAEALYSDLLLSLQEGEER